MSWKQKAKAKAASKFPKDPEEEREFNEMRRKYAYAIAFLLVKNIKQSELRQYLEQPENVKKYEGLKKFRADILEKRPRAKQWVDKGFYIGIKLGTTNIGEDGWYTQELIVNDSIFKQTTLVVSSPHELDQYMETIAKIIESEKLWSDPIMAEFDAGERLDSQVAVNKSRQQKKTGLEETKGDEDQLMLNTPNTDEDTEIIDTSTARLSLPTDMIKASSPTTTTMVEQG